MLEHWNPPLPSASEAKQGLAKDDLIVPSSKLPVNAMEHPHLRWFYEHFSWKRGDFQLLVNSFCGFTSTGSLIESKLGSSSQDIQVGGLEHFLLFHILGIIIIPIDELIFFRGVGHLPHQAVFLFLARSKHKLQLCWPRSMRLCRTWDPGILEVASVPRFFGMVGRRALWDVVLDVTGWWWLETIGKP